MKRIITICLAVVCCLSLCLTGCANQKEKQLEIANSALTKLYTAPNEGMAALQEEIMAKYFETGDQSVLGEYSLNKTNAFYSEMFAGEVAEDYIDTIWRSYALTNIQMANESGYTLKPIDITIEDGSNENLYTYTVTLEITDPEGVTNEHTASGRVQFNEENRINYLTSDKTSYYVHDGIFESIE